MCVSSLVNHRINTLETLGQFKWGVSSWGIERERENRITIEIRDCIVRRVWVWVQMTEM